MKLYTCPKEYVNTLKLYATDWFRLGNTRVGLLMSLKTLSNHYEKLFKRI
jgi:hypothetical protein